jgi:hypothetical protein
MTDFCETCGSPVNNNKCSGCSLVAYCSKDCQKKDWKEHKPFCKLAKEIEPNNERLEIRPGDDAPDYAMDVDLCLEYAQKYLKKLKHVEVFIDQDFLLDDFSDMVHTVDGLKFTKAPLCKLLQSRNFESVCIGFGDCCWEQISQLTSSGRVYLPLREMGSLQSFSLHNGVVDNMTTLCDCLPPQLKVLKLNYLCREEGEALSSEDCNTLVQAVTNLRQLVQLALADCQLRDKHVSILLSDKRVNLRNLNLAGCFFSDQPGSYLTDSTLLRIASSCPYLQAIDLSYQIRLSVNGIANFMQASPLLREANFRGIDFPMDFLLQMLTHPSASKLYLFSFGSIMNGEIDQAGLSRVMEATSGRIVFSHTMLGLIKPVGISKSIRTAYENSKHILDQAHDVGNDPSVHNKWNEYF